ncbi:hypothetical protein PLICRDRAFT_694113 [Plicaturopsis crispa FD-325 SS-3]|nr:hypothetical protein PLICRDRAFT_694113 [Plicaturopsis crispa FD-325 SS-3]
MRGNWSTAAHVVRALVHKSPVYSRTPSESVTTLFTFTRRRISHAPCFAPCRARSFHFHSPRHTSSLAAQKPRETDSDYSTSDGRAEPSTHSDIGDEPLPILTSAQAARAAAQAVRLSLQDGDVRDAYYVVNSARASHMAQSSTKMPAKILGLRSPIPEFRPIDFGQPISPRLAAHTLLHGLVAAGFSRKAAQFADILMRDGMQLRTATLHTILTSLSTRNHVNPEAAPRLFQLPQSPKELFKLHPRMLEDPKTRWALQLLLQARRSRQRWSQQMFQTLFNACLIQGEIFVGSLLFILLVKDFQLRKDAIAKLYKDASDDNDTEVVLPSPPTRRASDLSRWDVPLSPMPSPDPRWMYALIHEINTVIAEDSEQDPNRTRSALQALVTLASLLDRGLLPIARLAPLIAAMYNCPRVTCKAWVEQDTGGRQYRQVDVYTYLHDVLLRLFDWLPRPRPALARSRKDPRSLAPLPDLATCNSLLQYALRHRLSPDLAKRILDHMTNDRESPLQPNVTTYNILLRSGTLLRRHDISGQILRILRQWQTLAKPKLEEPVANAEETSQHDENHSPAIVSSPPPDRDPDTFALHLEPAGSEETTHQPALNHPFPLQQTHQRQLTMPRADAYTLPAYIHFLTSTGKPAVVARLLFRLIPELSVVNHPSWESMSAKTRWYTAHLTRQAALKRAVSLGPHVFASIVNALSKAGKTGLAERVWILAKQAEAASWLPQFREGTDAQPWLLPIGSYTSMLQCYAAEARKTLSRQRAAFRNEARGWAPKPGQEVFGWAYLINSQRQLGNRWRTAAGRKMGMIVFRSMKSGVRNVYSSLMGAARIKEIEESRLSSPGLRPPVPDARFFNAALDILSRHPSSPPMRARPARGRPNYWRRRLRSANDRYARSGATSTYWDPMLGEVAKEMVNAGYSVPIGYRHLFVGRWSPGATQWDDRREPDRRPHAFPATATART